MIGNELAGVKRSASLSCVVDQGQSLESAWDLHSFYEKKSGFLSLL